MKKCCHCDKNISEQGFITIYCNNSEGHFKNIDLGACCHFHCYFEIVEDKAVSRAYANMQSYLKSRGFKDNPPILEESSIEEILTQFR